MPFNVMRAKTFELFEGNLTAQQMENTKLNKKEAMDGALKLNSFPRRIVLELTNACNFNCIMCGRNDTGFKPTFLSIADIEKLSNILNYCEEVTLFGWGEPTIHPKFAEIIKIIHKYPVRKYFVTNGSTLKKIKDILFDYKVDIMAVSLDGATPETNNRIRKNADFNQIVNDLRHIVKIRTENKSNYPYINFVMTMMKSNIQELPDLIRLAADIGIEEVKAVYLTIFSEDLMHESLWNCKDEIQEIFEESINIAKNNNIKLKLPYLQGEDVAGEKYHKDCFVGWRDLFIGSDGYVRPCQSTPVKLIKMDEHNPIEEIWNSELFQNFRYSVNSPDFMPVNCKQCYQSSHANFNSKGSFIFEGEDFAPTWEKDIKPEKIMK